jgi:NAD(P)-dependent dehydrogenase (short-subunit alcohol dehydrogenase family)
VRHDMDYEGKVVLVAGGGSGIGRTTCEIFSERGGGVVVADVSETAAKATVETITRTGGRAEAVLCDVSRWEQVQAAVETARRIFGRLDILVNTAGTLRVRSLEETTEAESNDVLQINLTGAFLLTKAAMRVMRAQGGGAIVHIASRMAVRIKENRGAYAPSKAGILALTRMAALEGAPHGIRVNCVCPGWIDTPMTRRSGSKEQVDAQFATWAKVCPLGRAGRAEEVARAILFLASDEASFITGVALPVDGGRTIL